MEITRRLQALDEFICNNFHAPDIDQVLNEFDDLKTEVQTIYTKKGNVAISRSKCRWVEKGERSTKYFFNLERRNYNKRTISELRMENEMIIKNETQVLDAIESILRIYTHQQVAQHKRNTIALFRNSAFLSFLTMSEMNLKEF